MEFTHFNEQGHAKMVDVSQKEITSRQAIAEGSIRMNASTLQAIVEGRVKKGDVLSVAQVAGIMAAKNTSDIIPMCHPLMLSGVDISFDIKKYELEAEIIIRAQVKCKGETGVEMEALTAVSATALTIYDMCKALQKDMVIGEIKLLEKTGGKSGDYVWQG